jgi:hypothetical protein
LVAAIGHSREAKSMMYTLALVARSILACSLTMLFAANGLTTDGKLAKVTMDYDYNPGGAG